jgi:hypothetical protein
MAELDDELVTFLRAEGDQRYAACKEMLDQMLDRVPELAEFRGDPMKRWAALSWLILRDTTGEKEYFQNIGLLAEALIRLAEEG